MSQVTDSQIIAKAAKDEAFKKALLANPKAALESEFGVKLPEDVSYKVLEETANQQYLVLPAVPPAAPEDELSDAELEEVAGGLHLYNSSTQTGIMTRCTYCLSTSC
jgi:hypothetical protein